MAACRLAQQWQPWLLVPKLQLGDRQEAATEQRFPSRSLRTRAERLARVPILRFLPQIALLQGWLRLSYPEHRANSAGQDNAEEQRKQRRKPPRSSLLCVAGLSWLQGFANNPGWPDLRSRAEFLRIQLRLLRTPANESLVLTIQSPGC